MSEGIGARLRSARERSRLSILQAAEKLHVDPDILEALEAENFTALGAPVYVKGHLRHYAELVGESPEALYALYSQGARIPQPDLTRIPHAAPDDTGRLVMPAVVVVVVFAVAGTSWWALSLSHRPSSTAATRPVPGIARAVTLPQSRPMRLALAAEEAGPRHATVPAPTAAVAVAPHGQIEVVLDYSADSWTEVYDATGRRLLYGLTSAPAARTLQGVPPLHVLLGNARGVTLEIDGRRASISGLVRPDHTAWFLIAADGRVLPAAPRAHGD